MKLFPKQDDQGWKRKPRTAKLFRRMKNKRERRAAKIDPERAPTHNKNAGWVT